MRFLFLSHQQVVTNQILSISAYGQLGSQAEYLYSIVRFSALFGNFIFSNKDQFITGHSGDDIHNTARSVCRDQEKWRYPITKRNLRI
jgi:hypothetical protein